MKKTIEQSRRIIIIASSNFTDAAWYYQEFKTAQIKRFRKRINRIIVITDDKNEVNKDVEFVLGNYLKLRLFVQLEDPQFWPKLGHAMPRRPIGRSSDVPMVEL